MDGCVGLVFAAVFAVEGGVASGSDLEVVRVRVGLVVDGQAVVFAQKGAVVLGQVDLAVVQDEKVASASNLEVVHVLVDLAVDGEAVAFAQNPVVVFGLVDVVHCWAETGLVEASNPADGSWADGLEDETSLERSAFAAVDFVNTVHYWAGIEHAVGASVPAVGSLVDVLGVEAFGDRAVSVGPLASAVVVALGYLASTVARAPCR